MPTKSKGGHLPKKKPRTPKRSARKPKPRSTTKAAGIPTKPLSGAKKPDPKREGAEPAKPRRKWAATAAAPAPTAIDLAPFIVGWEDDPGGGAAHTTFPAPGQPTRLLFRIQDPTPQEADVVWRGSSAAALRRCACFWEEATTDVVRWQGPLAATLPVVLEGPHAELNAYYDRTRLIFYTDTIGTEKVRIGESPDIIAHEMGHAILDALWPELWGERGQTDEAAAFHEAFGDISALLCALSVPTLVDRLTKEVGRAIHRPSRATRIGEQFGWALAQRRPGSGDGDCLRNTANMWFYVPPAGLPTSGPDTILTRESHNFSRVFSGGFLDALSGVVRTRSAQLAAARAVGEAIRLMAKWLVVAVQTAAPRVDLFRSVAEELCEAAFVAGDKDATDAIREAFVRRGVLPLSWKAGQAPPVQGAAPAAAAAATEGQAVAAAAPAPELPSYQEGSLVVGDLTFRFAKDSAPAGFAAAAPETAPATSARRPSSDEKHRAAQERYLDYLLRRGRIHATEAADADLLSFHAGRTTHRAIAASGDREIERVRFDCGFDTW